MCGLKAQNVSELLGPGECFLRWRASRWLCETSSATLAGNRSTLWGDNVRSLVKRLRERIGSIARVVADSPHG